jgi:hypothetical protein
MPKMQVRAMAQYQSDLGIAYDNLSFKIRTGFEDCPIFLTYVFPPDVLCPVSGFFEPRYLQATFANRGQGATGSDDRTGARIKFPLADLGGLAFYVGQLRNCGAQCIDLIGERWNVVPPSIANYTAGGVPMVLPDDGQFADKRAGRANYTSDALGANQQVNVSYEILPVDLSNVIDGCAGPLSQSPSCDLAGIKPRAAIAQGAVDNPANPRATFRRKAPISDPADIVGCITNVGNLPFVQCVGYKGEDIPRVDLLFP